MANLYVNRVSLSSSVYESTQLLESKVYPAWSTIRYKQFQCKEPYEAHKGDWELLDTLFYRTIVSDKDFQKDFKPFEICPLILEYTCMTLDELDLETAQNLISIENTAKNMPAMRDFFNQLS